MAEANYVTHDNTDIWHENLLNITLRNIVRETCKAHSLNILRRETC